MDTVAVDCLILGGGLSGLWLLNKLRRAGYSTLLIHDGHALGGLQSLNSAGIDPRRPAWAATCCPGRNNCATCRLSITDCP